MAAPPPLPGKPTQCQALPPIASKRPHAPTRSVACAYGAHGFRAPPCIPRPRRATKPAAGAPSDPGPARTPPKVLPVNCAIIPLLFKSRSLELASGHSGRLSLWGLLLLLENLLVELEGL